MLRNGFQVTLIHFTISSILVVPFRLGILPGRFQMLSFDSPFENMITFALIIIVYILLGSTLKDLGNSDRNLLSILLLTLIGLSIFFITGLIGYGDIFGFFFAPFVFPMFIIGFIELKRYFGEWFYIAYLIGCCFYPVILFWLGLSLKSIWHKRRENRKKVGVKQ